MTPTEQTQYWRNRVQEFTKSTKSTELDNSDKVPMNQADRDAVCQDLKNLGWTITTCTGEIVAEYQEDVFNWLARSANRR